MPTPQFSADQFSSHNAAVVIRERIKEKRLFEAQFLFGLLDEDDMPPEERQSLERKLDGLLAVVRDLQLQANKYIAEGQPALARKMHREMERIAVDVPGLEFGKRQVAEQVQRTTVARPPEESQHAEDKAAGAQAGNAENAEQKALLGGESSESQSKIQTDTSLAKNKQSSSGLARKKAPFPTKKLVLTLFLLALLGGAAAFFLLNMSGKYGRPPVINRQPSLMPQAARPVAPEAPPQQAREPEQTTITIGALSVEETATSDK